VTICDGDRLVKGSLGVPTSENGNGKVDTVEIAVTYTEAPGRGWVADAPEIRSVASGETQDKALDALKELVHAYPELLDEIRGTHAVRRFEEVAV
jgi:predicted RNase H-like HicB family nuclease